jgi:hypothetical protein
VDVAELSGVEVAHAVNVSAKTTPPKPIENDDALINAVRPSY